MSQKHNRFGGRGNSMDDDRDSRRRKGDRPSTFDLRRKPGKHHGPYSGTRRHPGGSQEHPLDAQLFDFMIVVDFECTCHEQNRNHYPNEIIEFPGILVDIRRGIVDKKRSFHTYVKPWRNPKLTEFCTKLTGIRQEQVDSAPTILEAVEKFKEWYANTIPKGAKVCFGTDGPWDFKNFLFNCHVQRDHCAFPTIFYEYFDIRTTFARTFNKGDPIKLEPMLARMKLRFEGSPHCGFDDAYNIARLAVAMMKRGCVFQFLIAISLEEEDFHYDMPGIPLYRLESGSGMINRDHVEAKARQVYGDDYFLFAEKLAEEIEEFRKSGQDDLPLSPLSSPTYRSGPDGGLFPLLIGTLLSPRALIGAVKRIFSSKTSSIVAMVALLLVLFGLFLGMLLMTLAQRLFR